MRVFVNPDAQHCRGPFRAVDMSNAFNPDAWAIYGSIGINCTASLIEHRGLIALPEQTIKALVERLNQCARPPEGGANVA